MPIIIDYSQEVPPLPVNVIVERCGILLLDTGHVRWPVSELISWINEAMGAIMNRRPQAFARTQIVQLSAGTRQIVPEGSALLLDIVRNIAVDGVTPGRSVRRVDRQLLDDINPDWHTMTPKQAVKHYTFEDRAPTTFYVFPPAIAGTRVEMLHALMPDEVFTIDDSIQIGIEYAEAVANYVCYRCNIKDSQEANAQIATGFYAAFETALGMKSQSSTAASPNQVNNSV